MLCGRFCHGMFEICHDQNICLPLWHLFCYARTLGGMHAVLCISFCPGKGTSEMSCILAL